MPPPALPLSACQFVFDTAYHPCRQYMNNTACRHFMTNTPPPPVSTVCDQHGPGRGVPDQQVGAQLPPGVAEPGGRRRRLERAAARAPAGRARLGRLRQHGPAGRLLHARCQGGRG